MNTASWNCASTRVEIDVLHQQHRALPQRRHRLVRRVRLIDAQLDLARIGNQARVQQRIVRRIGAELGLLLFILGDRLRIAQPGLDVIGRAHRGARPQERREARKSEPGLVPQEDQVRLDRQAFFHHPARVVDVAVECAVGQVHHLGAIEPAIGLQVQQRLLDGAQRHRAVHRVFRHRECLDVERLRARQHHAVVVRLVAVAVDDRDVAGRQQRLHGHLVRRRRAVGDEEDVVGAEGARRHLLRLLDVAGRLQQAVEAARGGAAFGQEQGGAVELAHVADPVGLENRLAARDRQRMEGADRPLRVFLQVVEERRVVAILHALEDGEVQFEQLLDRIEDAAHGVRLRISGDLLDLPVGHKIEIELRPHALEHLRQAQRRRFGAFMLVHRLGQACAGSARHAAIGTQSLRGSRRRQDRG